MRASRIPTRLMSALAALRAASAPFYLKRVGPRPHAALSSRSGLSSTPRTPSRGASARRGAPLLRGPHPLLGRWFADVAAEPLHHGAVRLLHVVELRRFYDFGDA